MNEINIEANNAAEPILDEALAFERFGEIQEPQVRAERPRQEDSSAPAAGAQELDPDAGHEEMPALGPSDDAPSPPRLAARQALTYYESLVEESLGRKDQTAEALLAIHEQKLYRLSHASFGDYLEQRWGLSRSRGYQLVHAARVTRSRLLNGQPAPPNERQARHFAADGRQVPKAAGEDSYESGLRRVTRYLAANLAKAPPGEHQRWLQDVRVALDRLEQNLQLEPLPHRGRSPLVDTTPAGCTWPPAANSRRLRQANQRPSTPPLELEGADATTEVERQGEPASSATAEAEPANGSPSHPEAGSGTIQERPWPLAAAGSVLGLTMEQARKFGYCSTSASARSSP
jgi:hypothetical protein